MKKLVVLSFACALALVLSTVCSADEKADSAKTNAAPVVQGQEFAAVPDAQFVPVAPGCRCGFQSCTQPCFNGCQRPLMHRGYAAPCGQQYSCAQCSCGQQCAPYAYPYACGTYGYPNYTPLRNFFSRLFAPRPYCGYDAYYGPYGDFNNGCYAPCSTYGRCW